MKTTIAFIALIITSCSLIAQDKEYKREGDVYQTVEVTANPTEGLESYYKSIANGIKYPKQARKEGIEGKVYVELIIGKKGEILSSKVLKGIGSGCDEMARQAVIDAGSWSPGTIEGKPVKQKIVIPVKFALGPKDSGNNTKDI